MSKVEKQQVPKIRFNQFNDNWLNKSFADCFDIQNGYAYKSSNFVDKKTGKIVLTPGSIALGGGYQADKGRNYSLEAEIPENFIFKSGDIFITLTDLTPSAQALGYPAIVPADDNLYLHNQRLGKIINSKLEEMFLYNLLRRDHYHRYIVSTASGTTVKHSSATAVLSYETRMPEINEQVKIGNFFQQLDKLIELQTRAVESAETYKKAMLQKMFPQKGEKVPRVRFEGFSGDWELIELGEIVTIKTGKLDANAMKDDGQYDFYTSGIQKYKIDIPAFEGPAITIAGNGATVGFMHYADGLFNAYQRTYVLTDFQGIREFLYPMIGKELPRKIHQEARTGSIPYIVMDMLTELLIYFPALEEQILIGNYFQKLDQNIESEKKKLEQYQTMKRAMLQRMFV